jgi:hypothetical protein
MPDSLPHVDKYQVWSNVIAAVVAKKVGTFHSLLIHPLHGPYSNFSISSPLFRVLSKEPSKLNFGMEGSHLIASLV